MRHSSHVVSMLKRGTVLLWQALMEGEFQQRIELLRRRDERHRQELVGLTQKESAAAWQETANEQGRKIVELGNQKERLRQENERFEAEAKMQREQCALEMDANEQYSCKVDQLEQTNMRLRQEKERFKKEARLQQERFAAGEAERNRVVECGAQAGQLVSRLPPAVVSETQQQKSAAPCQATIKGEQGQDGNVQQQYEQAFREKAQRCRGALQQLLCCKGELRQLEQQYPAQYKALLMASKDSRSKELQRDGKRPRQDEGGVGDDAERSSKRAMLQRQQPAAAEQAPVEGRGIGTQNLERGAVRPSELARTQQQERLAEE